MERVNVIMDKQMLVEALYRLRARIDSTNDEAIKEFDMLLNLVNNAQTDAEQQRLPKIGRLRW